ncbi:ras-domain-containing protein [Meredithblackwellia eburnea MCA 4105]
MSIPTFKITLLGPTSSGKSSLRHRFVTHTFNSSFRTTIGADFLSTCLTLGEEEHEVKANKVNLAIWDTAGQERFRSLGRAFYRGSDAVVLVWDPLANEDEEDEYLQLKGWLDEFLSLTGLQGKGEEDKRRRREFCFVLSPSKSDLWGMRDSVRDKVERVAKRLERDLELGAPEDLKVVGRGYIVDGEEEENGLEHTHHHPHNHRRTTSSTSTTIEILPTPSKPNGFPQDHDPPPVISSSTHTPPELEPSHFQDPSTTSTSNDSFLSAHSHSHPRSSTSRATIFHTPSSSYISTVSTSSISSQGTVKPDIFYDHNHHDEDVDSSEDECDSENEPESEVPDTTGVGQYLITEELNLSQKIVDGRDPFLPSSPPHPPSSLLQYETITNEMKFVNPQGRILASAFREVAVCAEREIDLQVPVPMLSSSNNNSKSQQEPPIHSLANTNTNPNSTMALPTDAAHPALHLFPTSALLPSNVDELFNFVAGRCLWKMGLEEEREVHLLEGVVEGGVKVDEEEGGGKKRGGRCC